MRSGIVLVDAGRVALIERNRGGRAYYVFPGGKVKLSESREAAAKREALEELGLEVRVGRLLAIVDTLNRKQYYYLATRASGQFGSGTGKELARSPDSEKGGCTPVWLDIDHLTGRDVRPNSLARMIAEQRLDEYAEVAILHD